jgi:hypothetical protein
MPHVLADKSMNEQSMWLIIAVGGMALLYVLLRPRSKRPDPLAAAAKFPLSRQRDVEQQMQNLLVELSEMARQISAQLDTRAAKLELLLKEADEKLAALRAASAGAPVPTPPVDANDAPAREDASSAAAPSAPAIDPRHLEVYRLSDEGRPAIEISRLVNRPTGEIELILALRPK